MCETVGVYVCVGEAERVFIDGGVSYKVWGVSVSKPLYTQVNFFMPTLSVL